MSLDPTIWQIAWWWLTPVTEPLPMPWLEVVAVLTGLWSVACRALAREREHDFHLPHGIDTPWIDGGTRDMPHRREEFLARCRAALDAHGRPYVELRGSWDERFATAVAAIDRLLGPLAEAPPIAAQARLAREAVSASTQAASPESP